MNTTVISGAAPARRSVPAKALGDRRFARRIVRARKGKGSYSRKGRS
jgi:stalled ribosome alternative rescue factor ArfA